MGGARGPRIALVPLFPAVSLWAVLGVAPQGAAGAAPDPERPVARTLGREERRRLAPLVEDLHDPDPRRRHRAVEGLARCGELALPLIDGVIRDTEDPVRLRASALVLGLVGGRSARERLLELFDRSVGGHEVRALVALVLGGLREESVAPRLLRRKWRGLEPREASCYRFALGLLGQRAALLERRVERSRPPRERAAEGLALGAAGGRRAVSLLLEETCDGAPLVRRCAWIGLALAGDAAALPTLRRALERGDDEAAVEEAMLLAGAAFGADALLGEAERRLGAEDRAVARAAAALAGSTLAGRRLLVLAAREARNPERVEELLLALAAGGGAVESEPLLGLLGSKDPRVRRAAGAALALGGARWDQELLGWLARERDEGARAVAALAVALRQPEGGAEVIQRVELDEALRGRVLRTLSGARDPRLAAGEIRERASLDAFGAEGRLVAAWRRAWIEALEADRVVRRPPGQEGPRFDLLGSSWESDARFWIERVEPRRPEGESRSPR